MRLGTRDRMAIAGFRAIEATGLLRTVAGRAAYGALYEAYKRVADRALVGYIRRTVRPGDLAIDAGAHVGFFTRLLASIVGRSGRVVAYEPDPAFAGELRARIRGLPNAVAREVALGDAAGTATLYRGIVPPDSRVYAHPDARTGPVTVPLARLDDEMVQVPAFVKIDVQGAEGRVLRGMERTLRGAGLRALLIEVWPEGLAAAGDEPAAVFALAEDAGLEPRDPATGRRMSLDETLRACERSGYVDVAFERAPG